MRFRGASAGLLEQVVDEFGLTGRALVVPQCVTVIEVENETAAQQDATSVSSDTLRSMSGALERVHSVELLCT